MPAGIPGAAAGSHRSLAASGGNAEHRVARGSLLSLPSHSLAGIRVWLWVQLCPARPCCLPALLPSAGWEELQGWQLWGGRQAAALAGLSVEMIKHLRGIGARASQCSAAQGPSPGACEPRGGRGPSGTCTPQGLRPWEQPVPLVPPSHPQAALGVLEVAAGEKSWPGAAHSAGGHKGRQEPGRQGSEGCCSPAEAGQEPQSCSQLDRGGTSVPYNWAIT